MSWTLRARKPIVPPLYTIHTYDEVVEVHAGVAIVKTETARDRLLRSGDFDLVVQPPTRIHQGGPVEMPSETTRSSANEDVSA